MNDELEQEVNFLSECLSLSKVDLEIDLPYVPLHPQPPYNQQRIGWYD